jgi:hypothetical protein
MRKLFLILTLLYSEFSFSQVPECNNPQKLSHSVNKEFITELNGKPISYYLNHPEIDQYAKLYYQGKFSASDDTLTFAFLDSVLTCNKETKPFYLFVFNSVVSIADGALAEVVAEDCWAYFEIHPCEFFALSDDKLYSKNYCKWFDEASNGYRFEGESVETVKAHLDEIEKNITGHCAGYIDEFKRIRERVDTLWKEN